MTYTLILTLFFSSVLDGSPEVKYNRRVEHLTQTACEKTAADFRKQYGEVYRTTVVALCIQEQQPKDKP